MILIWLIVWAVTGFQTVHVLSSWNAWGIALTICIILDLLSLEARFHE